MFEADDYKGWNPFRKRLNPTAVPTIFEWKADKVPRRVLKTKLPFQPTSKIDESIGTVLPEQCVQEDQKEKVTILIPTHVLAVKILKLKTLRRNWNKKIKRLMT